MTEEPQRTPDVVVPAAIVDVLKDVQQKQDRDIAEQQENKDEIKDEIQKSVQEVKKEIRDDGERNEPNS